MALELLLLCALVFIFIVSFCGLLQKIKQSYERERLIAERLARRQATTRNSADSFSEVYVNSAFAPEVRNSDSSGVFPAAPPPYTQTYVDPPPNYDDVIKTETAIEIPPTTITITSTPQETSGTPSSPPPYTISQA